MYKNAEGGNENLGRAMKGNKIFQGVCAAAYSKI